MSEFKFAKHYEGILGARPLERPRTTLPPRPLPTLNFLAQMRNAHRGVISQIDAQGPIGVSMERTGREIAQIIPLSGRKPAYGGADTMRA